MQGLAKEINNTKIWFASFFFCDLYYSVLQQWPVILFHRGDQWIVRQHHQHTRLKTLAKGDWCKRSFVSKHNSHSKGANQNQTIRRRQIKNYIRRYQLRDMTDVIIP